MLIELVLADTNKKMCITKIWDSIEITQRKWWRLSKWTTTKKLSVLLKNPVKKESRWDSAGHRTNGGHWKLGQIAVKGHKSSSLWPLDDQNSAHLHCCNCCTFWRSRRKRILDRPFNVFSHSLLCLKTKKTHNQTKISQCPETVDGQRRTRNKERTDEPALCRCVWNLTLFLVFLKDTNIFESSDDAGTGSNSQDSVNNEFDGKKAQKSMTVSEKLKTGDCLMPSKINKFD